MKIETDNLFAIGYYHWKVKKCKFGEDSGARNSTWIWIGGTKGETKEPTNIWRVCILPVVLG